MRYGLVAAVILGGLVCQLTKAAGPTTAPLAGHPGNVFVAGEEVEVPLPAGQAAAWQAVDYEGKPVAGGTSSDGMAHLGKLPVGYYQLQREGEDKQTSAAVLARLEAATPADSPIGLDVAMAWFYKTEAQQRAAANLCVLAGINWVRDRLNWAEMEPQCDQFVPHNIYDDTARIQAEAGLRVLQVNHVTAKWAGPDPNHIPDDLRDAYRFYREMARRWKGQVVAFETWNEGEETPFGAQLGSELAAMQKASYLGLKQGNPQVIAGQNAFTSGSLPILEDYKDNQVWPYFDTYNFHHYVDVDRFSEIHARHRPISAGRPMWLTECNIDPGKPESAAEAVRLQAERVARIYAASLYEGSAATFFFILPEYSEGRLDFGLLHADLTPKPGYPALAAVGRLLAGAKPLGRVKAADAGTWAYLFAARPDGKPRQVLVAWSEKAGSTLKLAGKVEAEFDHIGRAVPIPDADGELRLDRGPVFVVLAEGSDSGLALEPPPAPPELLTQTPCPVVLQAFAPRERVVLGRSAYSISSKQSQGLSIYAYNFSDQVVRGELAVTAPEGWKVVCADAVELNPGDRKELPLTIGGKIGPAAIVQTVRITGDFGAAGRAVLSVRLYPDPLNLPMAGSPAVPGCDDVNRWDPSTSNGSQIKLSAGPEGRGISVDARLGEGDRWIYPSYDLADGERPGPKVKAARFRLTALEGQAQYRLIVVEESGACYAGLPVLQPQLGRTDEVLVMLEQDAQFGSGWSPPDPNGHLDMDKIRSIRLGCNTKDDRVRFQVSDFRWVVP